MSQSPTLADPETIRTANLVAAAIAASDFERAYALADDALGRGAVHSTLFAARALWLERQGRDEEALADFDRAASLAPRNPALFNAIGLCLTRLSRLDEAVAAFDEAIGINPGFLPSYHRKGFALEMTGDTAGAEKAYKRGVQLDPRNAAALSHLASLTARIGDPEEAEDYAARALKLDPREPTAIAARADLANRQDRFADAEQLTRPLLERTDLTGHPRAVVLGLLADSLDGQARFAEAFETYRSENDELRRLYAPRFAAARSATDHVRDLTRLCRASDPKSWRAEGGLESAARQHVFILGFFRSGTTLLGQVLGRHQDVVTLEERALLRAPAVQYLSDVADLARFAALSDEEIFAEREAYWRRVSDIVGAVDGKVVVDKEPMNTLLLPLIARLFPAAKIIFALRDPRDVVLSCFRRHFEVDALKFDLLTLDGAAGLYDAAMEFAEATEAFFDKPFYRQRYEDAVADFDDAVGRICEFLGITFDPGMRDFHISARAGDFRTPSAHQVRRELYSEGVGQWQHYRQQLLPVAGAMAPWVEKFGYAEG